MLIKVTVLASVLFSLGLSQINLNRRLTFLAGLFAWGLLVFLFPKNYYGDMENYIAWLDMPLHIFEGHRDFVFNYLLGAWSLVFSGEFGWKLLLFLYFSAAFIALLKRPYSNLIFVVTNPRFHDLVFNSSRASMTAPILLLASFVAKRSYFLSGVIVAISLGIHQYITIVFIIIFTLAKIMRVNHAHYFFFVAIGFYFFPISISSSILEVTNQAILYFAPGKSYAEYTSENFDLSWPRVSSFIFYVVPIIAILGSTLKKDNPDIYKFSLASISTALILSPHLPALWRLAILPFFVCLSIKPRVEFRIILAFLTILQIAVFIKNVPF